MREMWRRMRVRWRRRRMTSTPPSQWPGRGGVYRVPGNQRAAAYRPVRPWQVRNHRFRTIGLIGRGVDPAEVTVFLERVADDLGVLYAELDRTWEQNARIKDALRRWQSTQASIAQTSVNRAGPSWVGSAAVTPHPGHR